MNDQLQDVLFDGEEILWRGKPQKLCYILKSFGRLLPAALIFLAFDVFFIGIIASTGAFAEMWPFLVFFFAFHLLPVWKCIGKLITANLEYKNVEYAITNRRIIARTGIIGLDFDGIDYSDISNVRVDVSILERIFGTGSLIISSTSGNVSFFCSIQNPYDVYKKLNKILVDMKADVYYPNAFRPETNPGYNTKYKG
ncbi:MAG: PH domain-containing protein [Lachnospiraceae bacterium]|nr:PH domain-containing protein [Lachnospiraceae bacterium]